MTTSIIHGDPGSRKTATLVAEYGVPALYAGRVVVTNIRGFDSLERVQQVYKKELPDTAELISVPFTEKGFSRMARFFHWVPVGALVLMDEGQRIYPTRLRNLTEFDCDPPRPTPAENEVIATVEQAFDCHRHMNWDIYISTPNIAKVHKEIRQVAEYGYRQRDLASVVGPFAKLLGDIKRVKHDAESSGKSASSNLSQTNKRIDKRAFEVYQSTATGTAKETHTKANIFASPKLVLVCLFLLYAAYNFGGNLLAYGSIFPTTGDLVNDNKTAATDRPAYPGYHQSPNVFTGQGRDVHSGPVSHRVSDKGAVLAVLYSVKKYLGEVSYSDGTDYYFSSNYGGISSRVTSADLRHIGITVSSMGNFVVLSYSGIEHLLPKSRQGSTGQHQHRTSEIPDLNPLS